METKEFIMLKNVRVNFPHLFRKPVINGAEGKYGAVFILDPLENGKDLEKLQNAIESMVKERNKGKRIPDDKLCLRDGDQKGREEYEGMFVLSANSKDRPRVIDRKKELVAYEEDNEIYGGCYVNAKVSLWFQDNQYGKRINCELVAIQFNRDGEPFGAGTVSVDKAVEGFDEIDEDDDDFLAA